MRTFDLFPLITYFSGILLIQITPGQNMLMISSITALHGKRSVLPMLGGIATGQLALAMGLYALTGVIPDYATWDTLSHGISALLFCGLAWQIASASPPNKQNFQSDLSSHVTFSTGLLTAALNPLSATFLAAQFMGPLNDAPALVIGPVIIATIVQGIIFYYVFASFMCKNSIQEFVRRRFRLWSRAVACVFVLFAIRHAHEVLLAPSFPAFANIGGLQ